MPVTVEWVDETKTIMHMKLIGRWTWDELHVRQAEANRLLEGIDYKIGAIIDFRESVGIPLSAMANARSSSQKQDKHVVMMVFVGTNTLFMSLWNVFSKVYNAIVQKQQYRFADSLDDALRILAPIREARGNDVLAPMTPESAPNLS